MRIVNSSFDTKPSLHHHYIFNISKKYIKNKVVLDVGCWTGQYTGLASKVANKLYGLDPSSQAVKFAQSHIPSADFSVGSAVKLPYPKAFFDVVVISEVLEHVPINTELKVFKEIHRVLKKGGTLILSTPNSNILSIILDPAYFLLGHRHYSRKQIAEYLQKSGFEPEIIYTNKGFTHLLLSNFELLFKYTIHRKPPIPKGVDYLLRKELGTRGFATIYTIAKTI